MKPNTLNFSLLMILFSAFSLIAIGQTSEYVKAEKLWESADVLITSESVCYNPETKEIYVACINGNPTDKDGNGFIAKLSLDGKIMMQKWITGLDAPKGMGILKGHLYVTDINRVHKINITDEEIVKEFKVDGAEFLNDITVGPDGAVYISDMSTNKIHRIVKNKIEMFFDNDEIIKPNGLTFEDKDLLIGTKNGIFTLNTSDKSLHHLVKNTGSIDGLELDGKGNYIISDWSGKVQLVHPGKPAIELLNTTDYNINAADIEYIADRELLLIPTFFDNRVTAYYLQYK
jgi:DNA-binding beta-propeller fold protein YncE